MTVTTARIAAIMVPLALVLSGCEEFQGSDSRPSTETAAALGPDAPRTEVRDIERADIFSTTDTGLWDGRPSLGGIWVAHPDVSEAERAKITNTSNGQTIFGALFRRERANPGPAVQVSSEAAAALGMLAGQPVELSIVVVRQEVIELEPEPLPISVEGTETSPEPTASADEAADNDTLADDAALAAAGAGLAGSTALAEEPKREGFWSRFRSSLRNKPESDLAAEADTALLDQGASDASVPEVETAPLDPVTAVAAAAILEAEKTDSKTSDGTAALENPFIQVGLFSVEENADSAAASLRQAGIVPSVSEEKSENKTFWRVFVGPISSADDQAELLAQVKKLGYKDAFLAPN
jgi:cell division septation protein DedD